jgi:uncharacterized protein YndB with AHSA1/START domain
MTTTSTDRIEKKILLRAPRSRVWRALSTVEEFNAWFGVKLEGAFAPGKTIRGRIAHPKFDHLTLEMMVDRMEPERLFAYRWHPYAVDAAVDYSNEPTTLVELHLEEVEGGTQLTVVESGFDRVPAGRRAEAFRMNDAGWADQVKNIERHVARA